MKNHFRKPLLLFLIVTLSAFSFIADSSMLLADTGNVAYKKPVRSNLSKLQTQNVTDGDLNTCWSGIFFPAYVDVDLLDTYDIEQIAVYFPPGKKSYYSLYGSNDGKNYNRIYCTREAKETTEQGDQIVFEKPERYRIVRVYIEFTDEEDKAYLSEVKVYGKKTNTNTSPLRQGSLEDILDVKAFEETIYNQPITNTETIQNVYGIIDRIIGAEYRSWFTFELAGSTNEYDYFELSDADGKIHIKGNEGLSLTTGLNYYLKNYLHVHISEQTKQAKMPDRLVAVGETVRKETPYKVRYAFNYCTLNYTFSFFGEENWQQENDWLALNGVNVVLDLAGQEATWIKFLMNFGYTFDDAKDWLTGPAYYAWQFMDNMESFGGPVPDGYVKDRLELARKTQRWKRSLGMQTVLQGYAGMIPTNFGEYQQDVEIIEQGLWNGFSRPYMIATDSRKYDEYARLFYQAQEFVYGKTSRYYAVDPFHEGGIRPPGLTDDIISKEVLESLLEYNPEAVWIIQGWQSNPTNSLLNGLGEHKNKHVLIVDLIKYPLTSWTKYNKLKYDDTTLDGLEFNGTDWAWCLLANFGGNPSMHGQMDVMVEDIQNARKNSKHMQGLGIISEAMYDNPVIYELIFDLVWADENFDISRWLEQYVERRYGGYSEKATLAWEIMRKSNYNHGVRYTNELFGMKSKGPQDYGSQHIPYGAENLEKAFQLLVEEYEKFKDSEPYRYDLTEIMRQMVSNYAVLVYNEVLKARDNSSLEDFRKHKAAFLQAFDLLNKVQSTQKEQLGGEWIGKATDLAEGYDDFATDIFEMNAKTLISTWGSRGGSSLKDYGWRNYEGIFLDVYKTIWNEYLDKVEKNLQDGTPVETLQASDYFNFYWSWIMDRQNYTREAKNSPEEIKEVVDMVLDNVLLTTAIDPNAGNLTLKRNIFIHADKIKGNPAEAVDGSPDTQVRIEIIKKGKKIIYPEIIVDLLGEFQISEVNLLLESPDPDYEVYVSADNKNWSKLNNHIGRFVKIVSKKDITIKEFRVYGEKVLPTLQQLETLINAVTAMDLGNSETGKNKLRELISISTNALNNAAPPDEVNTVYWNLYDYVVSFK
ncbi:MAG: alpha-N-acetylglucosaminidase C-terminal domain-containing protein [Tannerellaceae bacterium]|nr:alpha-N-acetylglucosaminidase C-terminal domain-containing protein [Tannerellaceae bacterium]